MKQINFERVNYLNPPFPDIITLKVPSISEIEGFNFDNKSEFTYGIDSEWSTKGIFYTLSLTEMYRNYISTTISLSNYDFIEIFYEADSYSLTKHEYRRTVSMRIETSDAFKIKSKYKNLVKEIFTLIKGNIPNQLVRNYTKVEEVLKAHKTQFEKSYKKFLSVYDSMKSKLNSEYSHENKK